MRRTEKTRVFTVEGANALLPQLREFLRGVQDEIPYQRRLAPDIRRAAAKAKLSGGSPQGVPYVASVLRMKGLVGKIHALGVEMKDLQRGLCDFPHRRADRLVYLCWHPGEEKIGGWHELNAGFAGRKPL
ncbi:MAG: DUF2203 domain-containing protein [Nitrospinota bacterium]